MLITAIPAFSAIVFTNPTVEIPPDPTLKEWVADYPFKNTGDKPVTIKEVRPCCNCTTPKLDKKSYAAGEMGKLSLVFKTEGKSGIQEKHAVVITDDGVPPSVVFLKGTIPTVYDYFTLSTQSLRWNPGEPRSPKTIAITFKSANPNPYHLLRFESKSPDWILKLDLDGKGGGLITVTPPAKKNGSHRFELQTDFPTASIKLEINLNAF